MAESGHYPPTWISYLTGQLLEGGMTLGQTLVQQKELSKMANSHGPSFLREVWGVHLNIRPSKL